MPATVLRIVGMGACLPWCSISSSFQNSLKTFGHRGYEFLEFGCWNLVPFLPDIGFQLLKSSWSSLTYALMHPHTIRDAGFWTERWWHAGRSPSSLAQRTRCPWFPTRMSNLDSSDHRTLFHFQTVHFNWALAHRTRRHFWTMFTYGFLFAWLSFSWHLQMARQIVFTDSGFWKYSWAHLGTESCRWVMQCRLRARRPRASNKKVLGLVPYAQRFLQFLWIFWWYYAL